jgi:hypothetical protein
MGKLIRISLIITVMVVVCTGLVGCTRLGNEFEEIESEHQSDEPIDLIFPRLRPAPEVEELVIERITCTSDQDGDGLNDLDDIVEGARKDIENKPRYTDAYYEGGLPS